MKKVFTLLVILTLISSSAFAYDDLLTGARRGVGMPGSIMLSGQLVYLTASDMLDKDGDSMSLANDTTNIRIPLCASYGIMDNLSGFAILPIVSMDMGGNSETGIGDIWLGAKYDVLGMFDVRGALNLGIGDDKKGLGKTGGIGLDIGALGSTTVMDQLMLCGQAGLRWSGEDSDTKLQPGIGVYATGAVGYMIQEGTNVSGELELMTYGDSSFDGNDVTDSAMLNMDLNLSIMQSLSDNLKLSGTVIYTIMGENSLANMGVLIRCGYSL
ncbi:transporter [Candidatus Latescibacterota bacterium]